MIYEEKRVVLVCDDSKIMLQQLKRILSNKFHVITACSGYEAIAFASLYLPDLILLDIEMYGMSGFEAASRLKRVPVTKDIPIIFITAHGDPEYKKKGFSLGAVDYILKPTAAEELLEKVTQHANVCPIPHKEDTADGYIGYQACYQT